MFVQRQLFRRALWPLALTGSALLALAGGLWLGDAVSRRSAAPPIPAQLADAVREHPRPLAPFSLIDHHGQAFGSGRLSGKWTFLFFGYSHCPDVCPNTLVTLKQVYQSLESQAEHTQVVFVSVDPGRDDRSRLRDYVTYFDPAFLGVTGEPGELAALSRQMGVVYLRNSGKTPQQYTIDHSASILLVDPQGRLYAGFPPPHRASDIVSKFLMIQALAANREVADAQ